jgi:hypothetical protein
MPVRPLSTTPPTTVPTVKVKTTPESTQAGPSARVPAAGLARRVRCTFAAALGSGIVPARLVRLRRTEDEAHLGQPLHVLPDVEQTTFQLHIVPMENRLTDPTLTFRPPVERRSGYSNGVEA